MDRGTNHSTGWLAFSDVVLALFPMTIVWKLNLSLKKKAALCSLMGMGIL